MSNNIKILVSAHKESAIPESRIYLPLHVGAEISSTQLSYIGDNTGDNISSKNKSYCELTALYWAWKNLKGFEMIGLNHYRRYFDFRPHFLMKDKYIINESFINKITPSENIINNLLSEYDIILPTPIVLPYPVGIDYCIYHILDDLRELSSVIRLKYPLYTKSYYDILNGNKLSPYNMFITHKDIFCNYCDWLFSILSEVEKSVIISPYPQQARIFGYMGERLLNVYAKHNKLKIKYLPIYYVDAVNDTSIIRYQLNNLRFNLIGFLFNIKRNDIF